MDGTDGPRGGGHEEWAKGLRGLRDALQMPAVDCRRERKQYPSSALPAAAAAGSAVRRRADGGRERRGQTSYPIYLRYSVDEL